MVILRSAYGRNAHFECLPITNRVLRVLDRPVGSCSVRWDNSTMHAIVNVFGLRI